MKLLNKVVDTGKLHATIVKLLVENLILKGALRIARRRNGGGS